MYYRTYPKANTQPAQQLTITDLYSGRSINDPAPQPYVDTKKITIRKEDTVAWNQIPKRIYLENILNVEPPEISYTEYRIPKASGGYRTISAPNDELKLVQRHIHDALTAIGVYPHDSAYAYVTGRSCKQALDRHAIAKTKWFYKFDIKDFFPTCSKELFDAVLPSVYPFNAMPKELIDKLLHIALKDNGLPQGSPLSPLLSNIILTPFDFYMYYSIKHFGGVYTRYADDILISLPERKELSFVQNIVQKHLKEQVSMTLKVNTTKSRCGSIAGSNWNLGLMLNKDHNITLGHKKKMELKAKINNFIFDFTNENFWSIIDTQVLQGEINYFKQIEPEYATFVIQRLEKKYHNISLTNCIRQILKR